VSENINGSVENVDIKSGGKSKEGVTKNVSKGTKRSGRITLHTTARPKGFVPLVKK